MLMKRFRKWFGLFRQQSMTIFYLKGSKWTLTQFIFLTRDTFEKFSNNKTSFVTRIKNNVVCDKNEKKEIESEIHSGILSNEIIEFTISGNNSDKKLKLRKATFYDRVLKREYEFLTNLYEMKAI